MAYEGQWRPIQGGISFSSQGGIRAAGLRHTKTACQCFYVLALSCRPDLGLCKSNWPPLEDEITDP